MYSYSFSNWLSLISMQLIIYWINAPLQTINAPSPQKQQQQKNNTHTHQNKLPPPPPPPPPPQILLKTSKHAHTPRKEGDPLACTPPTDVIATSVGRRGCHCVWQLFGVIVPEKKKRKRKERKKGGGGGGGGVLSILNRPSRPADGSRWYYYLLEWCKTLRHRWATLRPEQNVYIFVLNTSLIWHSSHTATHTHWTRGRSWLN